MKQNDLPVYFSECKWAQNNESWTTKKTKAARVHLAKKKIGAEIVLLQETHSDPRLGQVIENEWGGKCYFSHGDRNSRGVCILFHPSLKLEIVDERSCSDGRFVVLKVLLNGVAVTIGNVYGPNYDE